MLLSNCYYKKLSYDLNLLKLIMKEKMFIIYRIKHYYNFVMIKPVPRIKHDGVLCFKTGLISDLFDLIPLLH